MKAQRSILVAAACFGVLLAEDRAEAQSARCDSVVAELRSLSSRSGGSPEAARRKIVTLEKRSAAFGCSKSSVAGRPRECAGISAQLNQARRQLAEAGSAGDASRRRRLQAEAARLRCGQAPAAPAQRQARQEPAANDGGSQGATRYVNQGGRVVALNGRSSGAASSGGPGGIFSLLFGGGRRTAAPTRDAADRSPTLARLESEGSTARSAASRDAGERGNGERAYSRASFGGGSYRTLCVRTCDGYYFPISTVTSRANFERDETVCRALCPGTEVALYAHPVGSESERMHAISDGLSYEALPAAFQYRKAFDPACTCAFEAKLVVAADGSTAIDVDAIAAAYSPATTSGAAEAIAAATRATGTAAGSLASPDTPGGVETDAAAAVNATVDDAAQAAPPAQAAPAQAAASPSAETALPPVTLRAGSILPTAPRPTTAAPNGSTPPTTAAPPSEAATGNIAATTGSPTLPAAFAATPAAEVAATLPPPAVPAAPAATPPAQPAAVATTGIATTAAGTPEGPGATAPRAAPVPVATRPTLRVRTIGPAFLQNQ